MHLAEVSPELAARRAGEFGFEKSTSDWRALIADPFAWDRLPRQVSDYLVQQRRRSVLPGPKDLLVETFPRAKRHYLTAFPFEGRLAHQTLGMLLTRRLERASLRPLGFAANDYGIAIWTTRDVSDRIAADPGFLDELFARLLTQLPARGLPYETESYALRVRLAFNPLAFCSIRKSVLFNDLNPYGVSAAWTAALNRTGSRMLRHQ